MRVEGDSEEISQFPVESEEEGLRSRYGSEETPTRDEGTQIP